MKKIILFLTLSLLIVCSTCDATKADVNCYKITGSTYSNDIGDGNYLLEFEPIAYNPCRGTAIITYTSYIHQDGVTGFVYTYLFYDYVITPSDNLIWLTDGANRIILFAVGNELWIMPKDLKKLILDQMEY